MQKTVRINLLARNNAAKHFQKYKQRKTKAEWDDWHRMTNQNKAAQGKHVVEERRHRRQDWIAGPLAPKRDTGTDKGVFGTVGVERIQHPDIPESVRTGPRKEGYAITLDKDEPFTGDTIVGNVVSGDRVVIVAGPERLRGLIGHVNSVDLAREEVKLANINSTDVRIPSFAQPPVNPDDPSPAKYVTLDVGIPMSHVRLVGQVRNDDGEDSDVIIRHVHAGPPYQQRVLGSNLPSHTRYVTDHSSEEPIEIPWPPEAIEDDFQYNEGDTERQNVQANSWSISLLSSPLGYHSNIPRRVNYHDNAYSRAPELLNMDIKGPSGLKNAQRVGLDGFVDYEKLNARRDRISQGIMNELRTKHKELNVRHDDAEWVKRKMIEDARAIWYKERKLVSPAAQAAELAVQKRAIEREETIARQKERLDELKGLAEKVQRLEVQNGRVGAQVGRSKSVKDIESPTQSGLAFVPDRKLTKALNRVKEKSAKGERLNIEAI